MVFPVWAIAVVSVASVLVVLAAGGALAKWGLYKRISAHEWYINHHRIEYHNGAPRPGMPKTVS